MSDCGRRGSSPDRHRFVSPSYITTILGAKDESALEIGREEVGAVGP
ncbi:MAG TPA: hypothetical protein GXX29_13705 [Firmicutes bacterium]|nr:hypothetical protein [Bacillota bacterium]